MECRLDQNSVAKGLLGRGGSALLAATVARARGFEVGQHKWHALSPDLIASVEQVLGFLAEGLPLDWLEIAVRKSLGGDPVASIPSWLTPVYQTPDALSFIGNSVQRVEVAPALGIRVRHPSKHYLGLAATALCLSRMQDTLDTLSRHLNIEERSLIVRMGRLAAVTVQPGAPTAMRRRIRALLKERYHG